jgi:hypothetical protein
LIFSVVLEMTRVVAMDVGRVSLVSDAVTENVDSEEGVGVPEGEAVTVTTEKKMTVCVAVAVEVSTFVLVVWIVCTAVLVLICAAEVELVCVAVAAVVLPPVVPLAVALAVAAEEDDVPFAVVPLLLPEWPCALLAKSLPRAIFCDSLPPPCGLNVGTAVPFTEGEGSGKSYESAKMSSCAPSAKLYRSL